MNRSTQPIGMWRVATLFLAAALGFDGELSVTRAAVDESDTTFAAKATAAGMLEVQASQTAITRAGNPDVRAFARRMVKGHTTVGDEFKTLAGERGITVSENLSADEYVKVDKLNTSEGAKFDKTYTDEVGVRAHKGVVSLFSKTSENAKDPDIRAFFTYNLPALREYLQMAEQLKTAAK